MSRWWISRRWGVFLLALFWLAGVGASAGATVSTNAPQQFPNSDCLACHTDFPDKQFDRSVHSMLSCVDCHSAIKDIPHSEHLPPPDCAACHQSEAAAYAKSIHGVSHQLGTSSAAECWDCHGSHGILPVANSASPVYKMNLPRTCGKCHNNPGLTREYRIEHPNAAKEFVDSIHGQALLKMGLNVAPACDDCHGVHDIKPAAYPSSPISRANIRKTCGKCHSGVEKTFDQSIHGQLQVKGVEQVNGISLPECTDCHTAHQIVNPAAVNGFKIAMDERCGKCHQPHYKYYRDTYHGQAILLGPPNAAPKVAACYNCHGYHDILPPADPRSTLHKTNILATCEQCHRNATLGFTQYDPHANPLDGKNYPLLHDVFLFMTGLLISVFGVFGLHTLLWLARTFWLYLRDSKTFREAKIQRQERGEWFVRFRPFDRFLHLMVITSFLLLVLTGMPLKFAYMGWAKVVFRLIGGPETARTLHHFAALVTFLYFGMHLGSLAQKAWRGRRSVCDPATGRFQWKRLWRALFGPDSLVPSLQDWRDFVAHNKWFFGKGPKPQFGRWTYWEKFDYFAVFWGVAIIGSSGLIMMFPMFFTRFLPGWIINIALLVHSDEALLAAGFIFAIHFFNSHFRIEKFPMDTVMFSGRISRNEMLHERKRWYDRLVADGKLNQYRPSDGWEGWRTIARSFGYLFFSAGVILLILIVYAMAVRLSH